MDGADGHELGLSSAERGNTGRGVELYYMILYEMKWDEMRDGRGYIWTGGLICFLLDRNAWMAGRIARSIYCFMGEGVEGGC
jgi:hypothetical protein